MLSWSLAFSATCDSSVSTLFFGVIGGPDGGAIALRHAEFHVLVGMREPVFWVKTKPLVFTWLGFCSSRGGAWSGCAGPLAFPSRSMLTSPRATTVPACRIVFEVEP